MEWINEALQWVVIIYLLWAIIRVARFINKNYPPK